MWRDFTKALREIWQVSGGDSGAYRPERHYMRGPGPKWHAKYGSLSPRTEPSRAGANSVLPNLAEHRA
jgi:hypothetical protein